VSCALVHSVAHDDLGAAAFCGRKTALGAGLEAHQVVPEAHKRSEWAPPPTAMLLYEPLHTATSTQSMPVAYSSTRCPRVRSPRVLGSV
jgi:hypothetical protein